MISNIHKVYGKKYHLFEKFLVKKRCRMKIELIYSLCWQINKINIYLSSLLAHLNRLRSLFSVGTNEMLIYAKNI